MWHKFSKILPKYVCKRTPFTNAGIKRDWTRNQPGWNKSLQEPSDHIQLDQSWSAIEPSEQLIKISNQTQINSRGTSYHRPNSCGFSSLRESISNGYATGSGRISTFPGRLDKLLALCCTLLFFWQNELLLWIYSLCSIPQLSYVELLTTRVCSSLLPLLLHVSYTFLVS